MDIKSVHSGYGVKINESYNRYCPEITVYWSPEEYPSDYLFDKVIKANPEYVLDNKKSNSKLRLMYDEFSELGPDMMVVYFENYPENPSIDHFCLNHYIRSKKHSENIPDEVYNELNMAYKIITHQELNREDINKFSWIEWED